MRKLLVVFGLCLLLSACSDEPASQEVVGTYELDKSAFEDALLKHTLEGKEMDSLLNVATEDQREQLIEQTKNSLNRNVHDLNWRLDIQKDGTFKLVTNTGSVAQRDSSVGTWTVTQDTLLTLITKMRNDSTLQQPITRRAVYKDGDILMEDDRMVPGLMMQMDKM